MELLYRIPAGIISLGLLILLMGAVELGRWMHGKPDADDTDGSKGTITAITGALLGVVGLLLGFSFAMASNRYETRRQLILVEANDIGTAYLRSDLLPAEASLRMKALMRRYVAARLRWAGDLLDSERMATADAETKKLQGEIWNLAVTSRPADSPGSALLLAALNTMIDVTGERFDAARNHVPEAVLLILILALLATGLLIGFTFFGRRSRRIAIEAVFGLVLSLVIYAILDLDRPYRGIIRISQEPMVSLQADLEKDATR